MTSPTPYVLFPGTARDALAFYGEIFGSAVHVNSYAEFNRTDGPADAVAHGYLDGPVALQAADAAGDEPPVHLQGLMFSLLGAASPGTLRGWFDALSEGGRVVMDLEERPWGATDGQVVDRFGLHWLIGFEHEEA